jgi:hypothetical protein
MPKEGLSLLKTTWARRGQDQQTACSKSFAWVECCEGGEAARLGGKAIKGASRSFS